MKRIALLGFVVFVIPVLVVSCHKEEPCNDKVFWWSYSKLVGNVVNQKLERLNENDTISEDTCYIRLQLIATNYGKLEFKKSSNPYTVMACHGDMALPANKIKSFVFGLIYDGTFHHLNDSVKFLSFEVSDTISSVVPAKKFSLDLKENEIDNPMAYGAFYTHIKLSFLLPHYKKDVQFTVWAIKEKGDTVKSISQKMFCK